jgi:hypothetical protein
MTKNATPNTVPLGTTEKTAIGAAKPTMSPSVVRATTTRTARPAAKPPLKRVAKRATSKDPSKAVPKPTSKGVAGQESKKTGAAVKGDNKVKQKKAKLVRDGFTMPKSEYDVIAAVKKRCVAKGLAVKKSEVLRAAIISFGARSDTAVLAAIRALDAIKTGRPPKGQK